MTWEDMLIPLSFAGFHTGITLLALYRARSALKRSSIEGRADRRTLMRLACLRLMAIVVALTGGLLAIAMPMLIAARIGWTILPTTAASAGAIIGGAWVLWIPATIALDNLAVRWLKSSDVQE